MVVGRGGQMALQFALLAWLSRILDISDFGVQAYVFPVAVIVQNIANSGLQSAIIQHPDLTGEEASALFWASMRWSAAVCGAMALSGFLLAALYRDWVALPVTVAWAAVTFGATLSAVHEAWLKRHFRFGDVLKAQLAAMVLSVGAAVLAAHLGARYWTFIVQLAVAELGRVALVWVICPWRPAPRHTLGDATARAVVELRAYWRGFAGARFLAWVGEQADRLTVAAVWGRQAAGLYEFARRWGTFAFQELYLSLTEVSIAALSPLRDDPARLRAYTRNAFLPILATSLPVLGMFVAEPAGVLHFLFGEKWLPAAPALRVMALAISVGSLGRLAQWVSLATGGTARQFAWTVRATPVFLACVVIGAWNGPYGAALGVLAANVLTGLPSVFYLLRPTPVRPGDVLPVWLVPMTAAVVGVGVVTGLDARLPDAMTFTGLVVRGVVLVTSYALAFLLLPGGRGMLHDLRHPPGPPAAGSTAPA
jgi:O-antigen/teichoic acid export membrane protein